MVVSREGLSDAISSTSRIPYKQKVPLINSAVSATPQILITDTLMGDFYQYSSILKRLVEEESEKPHLFKTNKQTL